MEVKIFRNELKRVANFLYSSENMMEIIDSQLRILAWNRKIKHLFQCNYLRTFYGWES